MEDSRLEETLLLFPKELLSSLDEDELEELKKDLRTPKEKAREYFWKAEEIRHSRHKGISIRDISIVERNYCKAAILSTYAGSSYYNLAKFCVEKCHELTGDEKYRKLMESFSPHIIAHKISDYLHALEKAKKKGLMSLANEVKDNSGF